MDDMAGYRRKAQIYKLQFSDAEFDGLEVMVRSIPVGEFLALARLHSTMDEDNPDVESIEKLFRMFANKLIGWNLEDEAGERVPSTVKGIQEQDLPFILTIIGAWIDAMSGPGPELGKGSTSGETSPEVDVPTVPLSPSLVS